MREEQVQNAVKFLSHPKVRGSPVMYRRSFLEKKGLTKEEIDEAFRLVPNPPPSAQATSANQADGQVKSSLNIQSQAPNTSFASTACGSCFYCCFTKFLLNIDASEFSSRVSRLSIDASASRHVFFSFSAFRLQLLGVSSASRRFIFSFSAFHLQLLGVSSSRLRLSASSIAGI